MRTKIMRIVMALALLVVATPGYAQFNIGKAIGGAAKAVQAFTITDDQMAAYVKESVALMDKNNPVLPDNNPYVVRLNKLVKGHGYVPPYVIAGEFPAEAGRWLWYSPR